MRKSSLVLVVLTLATVGSSLVTSRAANCHPSSGPLPKTASDPFGSCEQSDGTVKCGGPGSGADVAGLAVLIVDANKGVQGCAPNSSPLPIAGRVTVYKDTNNNTTVAADGSDNENSGGASGWQRYDVRPNDRSVCARRGTGGTYWTGERGGQGSSNPDGSVNHKVSPSGVSACQ